MSEPMFDQKTISIVNQIFDKLLALNPAFKQAWPTEHEYMATKREWMNAFQISGIREINRIKKGMDKCRLNRSPFIPSPGQFIDWCSPSPEDIGAPNVEEAFKEASLQAYPQTWKEKWSHEAVKHAYLRTGNFQFTSGKSFDTKDKFTSHYLQACLDFSTGKIMAQIEHKKPLSKTDLNQPETIGKYFFSSTGILDQYKNVSGYEEAMSIIEKIVGKGDSRLKEFVKNLERKYKEQNLI